MEAEIVTTAAAHATVDPFIFGLTVFVLACFVGYYVVWRVTPALHTPLMAVTNAVSGIIIVGAIIAVGAGGMNVSSSGGVMHIGGPDISTVLGYAAITLASVNIFGGFIVTQRMLSMFRKKEAKK
jgi:NAD(P) transhydrogenase subunit alpha